MFRDNWGIAIAELRANRLRSLLTMLGIVIGIASVIAIMTLGSALKQSTTQSLQEFGSNNVYMYIVPKEDNGSAVATSAGARAMKPQDLFNEEIMEDVVNKFNGRVLGAALSKNVGDGTVSTNRKELSVSVTGVSDLELKSKKLKILAGRTLSTRDDTNRSKVIMISDKLAGKLYGKNYGKAIGKSLECMVNGKYVGYSVVGVYKHKASESDFAEEGGSMDCYIPLMTAFAQLNEEYLFEEIAFVGAPDEEPEKLYSDLIDYVENKYYKDNDTYTVNGYSTGEWIKSTEDLTNALTAALSAIAAISLLVGGIGVMNIMVVSITERTREIGIRKALGATNRAIRMQFITESIVMCLIGGLIGIVIGIGAGVGISKLLKYAPVVPVMWILISVAFSMAFGVFFGLYPANKAAKLDPIEALRYE